MTNGLKRLLANYRKIFFFFSINIEKRTMDILSVKMLFKQPPEKFPVSLRNTSQKVLMFSYLARTWFEPRFFSPYSCLCVIVSKLFSASKIFCLYYSIFSIISDTVVIIMTASLRFFLHQNLSYSSTNNNNNNECY